MVNDAVDFNTLKDLLEISDGNLASHIKSLEKNEFVLVHKQFVGKKPKTTYSITKLGKQAFTSHLQALEKLLKSK
jgi:DNA-binding HxlR family transcriptional regulator